MRLNDVEFRWSDTNKAHELVKWEGDTCYVIAFFRQGKEGYDMETVGERFFEDHDAWLVGRHAIRFLNEVFEQLLRIT